MSSVCVWGKEGEKLIIARLCLKVSQHDNNWKHITLLHQISFSLPTHLPLTHIFLERKIVSLLYHICPGLACYLCQTHWLSPFSFLSFSLSHSHSVGWTWWRPRSWCFSSVLHTAAATERRKCNTSFFHTQHCWGEPRCELLHVNMLLVTIVCPSLTIINYVLPRYRQRTE